MFSSIENPILAGFRSTHSLPHLSTHSPAWLAKHWILCWDLHVKDADEETVTDDHLDHAFRVLTRLARAS